MQYHSPIKILNSFLHSNEDFTKIDFNILKRRILAEFELSGLSTIETEDGEFSKNDILNIFENQKNKEDFQYHLIIAKMPELMNFLEYNHPDDILSFEAPVFENEKFLKFISPYLANSLGNFFAACILNPKMNLKYALQKSYPILPEHEPYLLEPVYSAVDELINTIEIIRTTLPSKSRIGEAASYFGHERIRVFIQLPRKYFTTAVELFGNCGIDFIIDFLEKSGNKITYSDDIQFIFNQILKLPLSTRAKNKISAIDEFMTQYDSKGKSQSQSSGVGRYIFFFIFIIFTIIRLAMSDSKTTKHYDFNRISNDQDLRRILEESRKIADTSYHMPTVEIKPIKIDSDFQKILMSIDTSIKNSNKLKEKLKEMQKVRKKLQETDSVAISDDLPN